ncbi:chorismate synthase [Pseudomonadota bacterium]
MAGNTFGKLFQVTTWGESHGKALGVVIDGCPPNFPLSEKDIQAELNRRKPGQSAVGTSRKENDKADILSGVFEGKTTGTPISIVIPNKDQRSADYASIKNLYRPGHGDIAYDLKYGIRDFKGGGRASGRETVARVAAGAIAKKFLKTKEKLEIIGHTIQVGDIKAKTFSRAIIEKNPLRCADSKKAENMEKYILGIKKQGDSVGGIAEIIVKNVPAGLGEPVFDKLEADLGKALLSIGAVKGVEFGAGFSVAELKGSQDNDKIVSKKGKTATNNAGGTLGGISIGTDLIIRIAVKPAASILKKQETVNKSGKKSSIQIKGRHDACIIPRLIPVAESMVAITLMDHYLRNKSIN